MIYRILILLLLAPLALAKAPDGGGTLPEPGHADDRTAIERALTRARVKAVSIRRDKGIMSVQADGGQPVLQWPFRKAITVSDPDIQAISNFVDQDPSEGGLLDYSCGERTYDGHRGLDIYTTPFTWYKMERDEAIVIAAAPGTIVEMVNDQPERSCTIDNSGGENNLVVIEHADGSLAIYAHMRTGSLTAKSIGDTVTAGEYLGVVGSSGYSTGPHLHFEIGYWEQENNVWQWRPRDPFAGTCNDLNVDTWWGEQPDYYQPGLNAIATHSAPPETPECPGTETPNYQDIFSAGDRLYFITYYRDQLKDQVSQFKITRPNGATYSEWTHSSDVDHYASSYWYWWFDFPANADDGAWKFSVTFEGQTLEHVFYVDAQPPAAPIMPASNNAYNGSWFDPTLDGEGYNIVTADAGTVIYFYGNDVDGKRFWLISNVNQEVITNGKQLTFTMYESTGGTHASPMTSARGLSVWGELIITFTDCNNGTAILRGIDGEKNTSILKIVGVTGTSCSGDASSDGPFSGVWFDLGFDGEGFNLVVTPIGVVVYYYGFDQQGNRLWFISEVIGVTLQVGQPVEADLFKANGGTFAAPVPPDQSLEKWGTITINVVNCNSITITTDTQEGFKTSNTIRIVSVAGLSCVE